MYLQIHHLHYNQLKDIVKCQHQRRYRMKHIMEIILLLTVSFRISFSLISFITKETIMIEFWRLDPFSYCIIKLFKNLCKHYLMFALILSFLGIFGKIKFYFSKNNTCTFLTPYELIVHNYDLYKQCKRTDEDINRIINKLSNFNINNLSSSTSTSIINNNNLLIKIYCWFKTRWQQYYQHYYLIRIDLKKWKQYKLRIKQNNINWKDRIELLKLSMTIDIITVLLHVILVITSMDVLFTIFNIYIDEIDSFILKILIFIDLLSIVHQLLVVIQCGLIFFSISLMNNRYINVTLNRLNERMKIISIYCHRMNNESMMMMKNVDDYFKSKPLHLNRTINHLQWLHQQHGHICWERLYSYKEVWGNSLLNYLMISIPLNVIAVSGLTVKQLSIGDIFMLYLIIIVHATITMVILMKHSKQTRLFNKINIYLSPIIRSIVSTIIDSNGYNHNHNTTLRMKLKFNDLYNRTMNGRKIGPYASILGTITNLSIFNLAVTYVGLFIFISSHIN